MTLAALINNVSSILASFLGWIPDVFEVAVESPIVMLFLGAAIVGVVVGFAKKLMHI